MVNPTGNRYQKRVLFTIDITIPRFHLPVTGVSMLFKAYSIFTQELSYAIELILLTGESFRICNPYTFQDFFYTLETAQKDLIKIIDEGTPVRCIVGIPPRTPQQVNNIFGGPR